MAKGRHEHDRSAIRAVDFAREPWQLAPMMGVFGLVGVALDAPGATLAAMSGGSPNAPPGGIVAGPGYALGATGVERTAVVIERGPRVLALHGHPYWTGNGTRVTAIDAVAAHALAALAARGADALSSLHGDYALALVEPTRAYALLAVDRMSVRNIVYSPAHGGLAFAASCDALARVPGLTRDVDPQRVFDYLYFHMVPGPATVFRGWRRVPGGHLAEFVDGRVEVRPHWQPVFAESQRTDFNTLKGQFRDALEDGVRTAADGIPCGAFLSGGTDSSTIAGLLGRTSQEPARTFSIGFAVGGYDEMAFARTAARHFGTAQHEYYVTADDVVSAVPRVADAYDQPFGNASAIPTYYCARLARDNGVARLLGGDGGDELFGGNARYARQQVFARYERLPESLRRVVEPIARSLPFTEHVPLLRKTRSYVMQAATPMPDRYDSYNLLERLGVASVLAPDFLAAVDLDSPRRRLREAWSAAQAGSLINRMLALDFQFTLADSDLPKVTRMCELAGIDVTFPMLHDSIIDFSLALPPELKLRGTTLRWFFKRALADFLPAEIIAKEKHGFGLPVGAWLQSHAPLRELANDSLTDLRARAIVRSDFLDRLIDRHLDEHPAYFGTMVWILMMLELWFRRIDGRT